MSKLIATWNDEDACDEVRIVSAFAISDETAPIEVERVDDVGWLVGNLAQQASTQVYQTSRYAHQSQLHVEPDTPTTFEEIKALYKDSARCPICGSEATEVIDYDRGLPQFYCNDCEHGWYAEPKISSFDGILFEPAVITRPAVKIEGDSADAVAKFLSKALNKIVHAKAYNYRDGSGEIIVEYDSIGLYLPYGIYIYIGDDGEVHRYKPEFEDDPDLGRFRFVPNNLRKKAS